ncbi:MAG TPA: TonB-dependent receptor [Gammaproteobacteria bacterium]
MRIPTLFLLILAINVTPSLARAGQMMAGLDINITQLSIEDLLNLKITSVSKKTESIALAPAAIHVLTAEDIRRSGATSIPEVLRLVPGIQVARIDANKWAVSSRGFNSRTANKLLVLIDGRNVYDFLFTGVLWETKDVMLESVERIEVIRGPGGTLWGANAVNGVINIITKAASQTQGGFMTAGGGTEERAFGAISYGSNPAEDQYLRVSGKSWQRDEGFLETGDPDDGARLSRAGFRYDIAPGSKRSITLQGDVYDGQQGTVDESIMPDNETAGGNLLGRWTQLLRNGGQTSLQFYYDRTELETPVLGEKRNSFDLEFQHDLPAFGSHHFIYGINYRYTSDEIENSPVLNLIPDERTDRLVGAFLQDEIALSPDGLFLTLGAKFESNDYTGSEVQPNIRLLWQISDTQSLWAAVSRAVRTPSRLEDDFFNIPIFNPDGSFNRLISGDHMQEAEELLAYEMGFRFSPAKPVYLDIAVFRNKYDSLVTTEELSTGNKSSGDTNGLEIAATYAPDNNWKLTAGYSFLQMDLSLDEDSFDQAEGVATLESVEGSNPEHQAFVRAGIILSSRYELDMTLRFVDELPAQDVSDYTVADVRLAGHINENTELAIVGQNLFEDHFEQGGNRSVTEVESGVYLKISHRFQ